MLPTPETDPDEKTFDEPLRIAPTRVGRRRTRIVRRGGRAMTDVTCETGRPEKDDESDADDEHLADVEAGAGCTEIWEHLAEQREE